MRTFGIGKGRAALLLVVALLLMTGLAACNVDEFLGVFVTMRDPGVTADGVEYGREDILMSVDSDDGAWSMAFDGSEHGLTPRHNIAAFSLNEVLWANLFVTPPDDLDDFEPTPALYLSFSQTQIAVPGIAELVRGQDIVRFDETEPNSGPFEVYFDGSDVGLTTASEKIDGLGVWPPEYFDYWAATDVDIPVDCHAGVIFVTTQGNYRVPSATPGQSIIGKGSDVLLFCAFNTGPDTAGLWYRVYNGVEEGIRPYQAGYSLDVLGFGVDLLDVGEQAADLDVDLVFMFTPRTTFTAPALSEPGQPSELFVAGTGGNMQLLSDFDDAFEPVNGVIDGISLLDFASAP